MGTPPPVVGIGASARGVKALQSFFGALPHDLGAAFVVVVHLAPERDSELAHIRASKTSMPVVQVQVPTPLEGDHVYVIPPDRQLEIADGRVAAVAFDEPRGRRAPIDLFFRSLAREHGDGCAVVLTGAGSDGALGLKAIKEAGGIILVQDPQEAEYPSMPRSAVATGLADFVLPLDRLVGRLADLVRDKRRVVARVQNLDEIEDDVVQRILAHLRARTGHDFSLYKRSTVLRRLARRMQLTRRDSLGDYFGYLKGTVEEVQALFFDLLISVTTFFRDPGAFEMLAKSVVPALVTGRDVADGIRVWVPGCATGEEAYTISMLLLEEASRHDVHPPVQVFASDLDSGALAVAREGRYPMAIEGAVSEERLKRFFAKEGDHYRVVRDLRDTVLFASHSVLKDPPFSRLDLISCRNLLIYLDREVQQQVCSIFHYALKPGGYLFLGLSETADAPPGLFRAVDRDARIYQSIGRTPDKQVMLPRLLADLPAPRRPTPEPVAVPGETTQHRLALESLGPPSILVDEAHNVVHLSESAGRYVQPSGGRLTTDVAELVRPELRPDLRYALREAFERGQASLSLPILVRVDGAPRRVYLQVRPVTREGSGRGRQALVFFIEGGSVESAPIDSDSVADSPAEGADRLQRLDEELHHTRAQLRTMREESAVTNEELRAANEELQSINEEYPDLDIKWFTPCPTDLFGIKSSDAGRPIGDFAHQLDYHDLLADARAVMDTTSPIEREARDRSGRWYLIRLRPHRTVDDSTDGVVITFIEVTERRQAEKALKESEERLRQMTRLIENSREPIFV